METTKIEENELFAKIFKMIKYRVNTTNIQKIRIKALKILEESKPLIVLKSECMNLGQGNVLTINSKYIKIIQLLLKK